MIVHIIQSAPEFAGTQQYILQIALSLKARGGKIELFINRNTAFAEHLITAGVNFEEFDGTILNPKNIYRLIKKIKSYNTPICCHAHLGKAAIAGAIVKQCCPKIRLIFTQHFIHPASRLRISYQKIMRTVFSHYSALIAISTSVKKSMCDRKEAPPQKIHIIANGTREKKITPNPDSPPMLLTVCRLEAEKSIAPLIDLYSRLYQKGIKFQAKIVGSGRLSIMLAKKIRSLGLENTVFLAGQLKKVTPIYQAATVLIHPAAEEPFGLVLIEAMAAQLPVIALNSGGPMDIIQNNETGFLVNTVSDMASKIEYLIQNPQIAKQLGQNSYRRFLNHFTIDHMIEKLLPLYGDPV